MPFEFPSRLKPPNLFPSIGPIKVAPLLQNLALLSIGTTKVVPYRKSRPAVVPYHAVIFRRKILFSATALTRRVSGKSELCAWSGIAAENSSGALKSPCAGQNLLSQKSACGFERGAGEGI